MIADSHCHAWQNWPYSRTVSDAESRGSAEALLQEMDLNGVARAVVVCARIGGGAGGAGFPNEENNEYVAKFAQKYPDRLQAWIDVDCVWRPEYHTSNAAQRLKNSVHKFGAQGVTHYVAAENDGWFRSDAGREFFQTAAELKIVLSLAVYPNWLEDLRSIALSNPTLPILIHHMGLPKNSGSGPDERDVLEIIETSKVPNIGVKVSGFHYINSDKHNFPYPESQNLFERIFKAFGPRRLFWGSDFPASRDFFSYSQALEVVQEHSTFLKDHEMNRILGENLVELLKNPYLPDGTFV